MIEAADIIEVKSERTVLVKISHGDDVRYWVPFQGADIAATFILDAKRVLAVSNFSDKHQKVTVFDLEVDRSVASCSFDAINIRDCYLNQDLTHLFVFGYTSLTMICLTTFESTSLKPNVQIGENPNVPVAPAAPSIHIQKNEVRAFEPVVERPDGTLLMGWDLPFWEAGTAGVLMLDQHTIAFEAKLLANDYDPRFDDMARWFSPNGNYCLRRSSEINSINPKTQNDAEDYTQLWDISGIPKLLKSVPHKQEGRPVAAVWDASSETFWLLFKGHIVLRVDVSGNSKYSPTVFARWANETNMFELQKDLSISMPSKVEYSKKTISLDENNQLSVNLSLLGKVTMQAGTELKRVENDEPLLILAKNDGFVPVPDNDDDKAAKSYVRSLALVNIPLMGESDPEIVAALNNLTKRIETDFEHLIWRNQLAVAYRFKRRKIVQQDLLEPLINQGRIALVPALKRLINTYLDNEPPYGLCQNTKADLPAFFSELRALSLLDRESTDVFRRYFMSVSSIHQRFLQAELIPELFEKEHLSEISTIALKLFLLMHYCLEGSIEDFGTPIIESACDELDQTTLSYLIETEFKWFETEQYPRLIAEFRKAFSGRPEELGKIIEQLDNKFFHADTAVQ